ncbi:hypothetical protein [Methylobacter tundripaludum]|uniref:hypothetical protein n=1 Tax=Methylobacter tundripaludum TaxID=173365 RepID=UPI0012375A2F|nr:hypothetical protein [Methylobacter tundripaludum]
MTDEIGSPIHPEYLTTANICSQLAREKTKLGINKPIINAEVQTRIIERQILQFSKKRSLISRNGRVDVEVVEGCGMIQKPRIVVEAKGFLQFKQNGDIYKGSFDEISKDIYRNKQIVSACIAQNTGPICAASTFFVKDQNSLTEGQGSAFLELIKQKLLALKPTDISYTFDVELKTMTCSNLYSDTHIPGVSIDGEMPEEELNPPSHIICGVIYMHS